MPTSSELALVARDLGKRYTIGESFSHDTARDWVAARGGALLRRGRAGGGRARERELWALRDVAFEIARGEIVGLVGRNGAGKSTLLRIVTRVTRPSTGSLRGFGRVGSLLELGTGFHPELTGRENVFLSGAVLGMRRSEIARKFDQIVDFAGIEPFLGTPVKRYSSGMYVRLGFAVAAHLDPDILAIDEVLAVGDAAFQRKCLDLVRRLADDGRTVLLVSHNASTVTTFCGSALLLERGRLIQHGPAPEVVRAYMRSVEAAAAEPVAARQDRGGAGEVRLTSVAVEGASGRDSPLTVGQPATFVFGVGRRAGDLDCSFTIYDAAGAAVTYFDSGQPGPGDLRAGGESIACDLDELLLPPGRYRLNVALYRGGRLEDHVEAAAFFEVEPGRVRGRPVHDAPGVGLVHVPHRWRLGVAGAAHAAEAAR